MHTITEWIREMDDAIQFFPFITHLGKPSIGIRGSSTDKSNCTGTTNVSLNRIPFLGYVAFVLGLRNTSCTMRYMLKQSQS